VSAHTDHVYQINQVVKARVEQILPFGIFVCLPGGDQAYVRRRELTQAGNLDPRQVVSEGQEIQAVVVALAEPGQHLELSVRRAEPDPWDTFAESFKVRDTVTATVKSLSARGVYVQIVPGVDGFIPSADLAPWPVEQPGDLLWVGDQVEAMIVRLDRQTKRVRLSTRRHMEHQTRVREVMALLGEKDIVEEDPAGEEETGSVEAEDESIDPAIVERIGEILVVDDHDEVRNPLVKWLRRLGFAAKGVGSPEQALACLRAKRYGLALIDLDLSGQDGLVLIHHIAKISRDTRVAVVSVPEWLAQRSDRLAALGVTDVFVKPLDLDEIRKMLVRLGRGKALGALEMPECEYDEGGKEKEPRHSFQRLGEMMRSGLPLATRLEAGLQEMVRLAWAEGGLIFHLDPNSRQVSIVAQVGELPLHQEAMYALGESPVKDVIVERNEIFEGYVSQQAQRRFSKLLALLPFESCLGVPIPAGGEVEHALFLFHRQPDAFSRYRLRDAQAMAVLFSAALESQALEQRIRTISPFLLSGHLTAGFSHEVYNKMSGLEIQLRNLQADCERLRSACSPPVETCDLAELGRAVDQVLDVALNLKDTVGLFRELLQAEQEEEVDVNEVVTRTVRLLRPVARRNQVHIETHLAPDLPAIYGSAIRLQQVFANLMLNAVQHTAPKMTHWPAGQGTLQVATSWEPAEERPLRVRLTDNGPGIHRQLWENIFALGFSTRPGGTGLGLFIARSLVESMGGRVMVERSAIPAGTTFRVELPAA